MAKRVANLFGAGLINRIHSLRRLRRAAAEARPRYQDVIERLEGRIFLSSVGNVLWHGNEVQAVPGEYVVQTNSAQALSNLAAKEGFTQIQDLGGQGFYQFDTTLSPAQVQQLSADHPLALTLVEPNIVGHIASTFPTDPQAVAQWYLKNTGQTETFDYNQDGIIEPFESQVGTPGQDIDAQQAWDITQGSSSVIVAVLDTGIDLTHPDLMPNIWTNPNPNGQPGFPNDVNGWNFVANTNDVTDDNGHGTNVSGIIGAVGNNDIGVAGVNWNVTLLPVKVAAADGTYLVSREIAGINYVTMLKSQGFNIVVMNESLGGPNFPFNVVESNAVKAAGAAGIVDVVAAGNDGLNLDTQAFSLAKLSLSGNSVITVAATDNQGKLAGFSNFGASSVDLAAPGINIVSTLPGGTYGPDSGTSQATPQVTGIIALESAVKPNATPEQLKRALLDGVTPDAYLTSVNGLPPKVRTAGVANAFAAVKDILDQFVSTDTTRSGNWAGFYGSQGAYVVGDSTTFPSLVNVTFDGVSPVILNDATHRAIGLQKISDLTSHIEAYDATANAEDINLNFTDAVAHRVGLYVADIDHKRRVELVQIIDPATGLVLNSQVVSNFTKGEYLFYDLRGSVQIKLTRLSGPSAVFSGLFFDLVPGNPNVFISTDTTTGGQNWRNSYGSQGAEIVGDAGSLLPSYVTGVTTSAPVQIVKVSSNARQSLQRTLDTTHGIQAYWTSPTPFDINVITNNTDEHQITLYLDDYDNKRRSERVLVLGSDGTVLYSQDFFNFSKGVFASFLVPGNVTFDIIPTGGPSAVVSGVFFDAAPAQVRFTGTDSTSQGNWQFAGYGSMTADVVGENFPQFDDVLNPSITTVGGNEDILSSTTSDPRALLSTTSNISSNRTKAYLFTTTAMTMSVNFADNLQHHVALYFADYERLHRVESVIITDAATNTILVQQRLSNFDRGKYLLYDISGQVQISIIAGSLPNAVFSGFFSD